MKREYALPVFSFFAFVLLWESMVYIGVVNSLYVPPPTLILKSLFSNIAYYLSSIGVTLKHIAVGYVAGISLAIPLGLLFGWHRRIELAVSPLLLIISTIPVITFLPLFILWFGLNEVPVYLCALIAAFFPALLSTMHGVKKIDKSLIEAAHNLGEKRFFSRVILPAATPHIVNGSRLSIEVAFLVTPVAEMMMGYTGIGGFIWKSADLFRMELVILGMLTLGMLGVSLLKAFDRMEYSYLLKWMPRKERMSTFG